MLFSPMTKTKLPRRGYCCGRSSVLPRDESCFCKAARFLCWQCNLLKGKLLDLTKLQTRLTDRTSYISLALIREMCKGIVERQFATQFGAPLWIESAVWIHNVNSLFVGTGSFDNCFENMALTFFLLCAAL